MRSWEGSILIAIGSTYANLGDYTNAIRVHQEALEIFIELEDLLGQGNALNEMALAYRNLNEPAKALELFELSLEKLYQVEEATSSQSGLSLSSEEATTKGNIARTLNDLGRYDEALTIANEVLDFRRQEGDLFRVSVTLNDIGNIYLNLGDFENALSFYQEALKIRISQNNLEGQSITLARIGAVFEQQQRTDLAIIFYKRSIDVTETLRAEVVPEDYQESYLVAVDNTYRLLAELLLQRNRILEAQQVLELLKVEEIREFTRATYTTEGLQYDPLEESVVEAHDSLMAVGAQIYPCDPDCDQTLYDQQIELEAYYDQQVLTFEETVRRGRAEDDVFYDPTNLASDAFDIVNAQPGTVLIYPFVQEDDLWLLWTATGGVVGSVKVETIDHAEAELGRAVFRFRELLKRQDAQSFAELKRTGQQLYGWLIEPLKEELEKNNIQQLVFAQDRTSRYLPMAALHDGDQFLIERYTVSTVLSAALTDTTDRLGDVNSTQALALGLDQAISGYSRLPNVREELDGVVKTDAADPQGIYPGQVFMNNDFTFATLSQQVRRYRILHIATHAEFVPYRDGESFILSGTGEKLTIAEIGSLDTQFDNLHLVVLSACQTALGDEALDGTEIAGVSSYFLGKNKAEAVLATLWRVDDEGTSLLMQRFYEILATGQVTKAEALQQAQLSLLQGEEFLTERLAVIQAGQTPRGSLVPVNPTEDEPSGLSHPYYWAPFILIGNGL
ncbi:MAG: CHAT domain-containing protein [Leptolyngbya sp. SIO1D8]|nr:CHAT domain-containing protein [Leptolyngbya sp. SIO1D8]